MHHHSKVRNIMYCGHRTLFINYADAGFAKAQQLGLWAGKFFGKFDEVKGYGPDDLDPAFRKQYSQTLSVQRGAGLWLWKPYIILKALDQLAEGDYLFYCDSGAFFLRSCKYIFDAMQNSDIWVSDIPLIEKEWSKPALFQKYGIGENDNIRYSNQIQGGFIGVRKSESSVALIRKWYHACCVPELLWPMDHAEPHGDCIAHREDQSILSVLCKIEGIKPHRDPTQFGRLPEKYRLENAAYIVPSHSEDDFPALIILHRSKDCEKLIIIKKIFMVFLPIPILKRLMK